MIPGIIHPYGGGKATSIVFNGFVATSDGGGTTSPFTFSNVAIGPAFAGRFVIIGVATGNNTSTPPTVINSVTINGTTATQLVTHNGDGSVGGYASGFYGLTVSSGTTCTVVVTAATGNRCGISSYSASVKNITPTNTNSISANTTAIATTISCQAGGFILGINTNESNGTGVPTFTWTGGLSEDMDNAISASTLAGYTTASKLFNIAQSGITITSTSSQATSPNINGTLCLLAMK